MTSDQADQADRVGLDSCGATDEEERAAAGTLTVLMEAIPSDARNYIEGRMTGAQRNQLYAIEEKVWAERCQSGDADSDVDDDADGM